MVPDHYDPNSTEEQPIPLPSASLVHLNENAVLQPPLTRRGTGPGLIVFLPPKTAFKVSKRADKPLDPEPVLKWAEEGFAVLGITCSGSGSGWSVADALTEGLKALIKLDELDTQDKFAVVVYYPEVTSIVISLLETDPRLACVIVYGSCLSSPSVPALVHLAASDSTHTELAARVHRYTSASSYFVLPQTDNYDPGPAGVAHSRTLVFLRKILGGPIFDIEAVWEEHTYFEFEVRSVAKTMATMVAEPYVNHVPTMTGGVGRKNLTAFYRDHFIFSNPTDTRLQLVSRTVGADRVVDEFIFHLTHNRTVDWLLPGVPPTDRKLAIPMLGVINVRGDRLYHEHIWWDQATCLLQAGLIPSHLPFPLPNGQRELRLPVAGDECARLLVDETDGKSNEMFGKEWGVKDL